MRIRTCQIKRLWVNFRSRCHALESYCVKRIAYERYEVVYAIHTIAIHVNAREFQHVDGEGAYSELLLLSTPLMNAINKIICSAVWQSCVTDVIGCIPAAAAIKMTHTLRPFNRAFTTETTLWTNKTKWNRKMASRSRSRCCIRRKNATPIDLRGSRRSVA